MPFRSLHEAFDPQAEARKVVAARARVLASTEFHASARQQRLLTYLIDETLADRADRLKAFNLATEVLGRDNRFDPQTDPVVRVEMGHLRRHLEHYYLTHGKNDEIRIGIPKGAYVPHFEHVSGARPPSWLKALAAPLRTAFLASVAVAALAALLHIFSPAQRDQEQRDQANLDRPHPVLPAPEGPAIRVDGFTNASSERAFTSFASGLRREVISALARFKSIQVFAPDATQGATDLTPDYRLRGVIRKHGDDAHIAVQLLDMGSDRPLWTQSYTVPPADIETASVDIAAKLALILGDPYGPLIGLEEKRISTLPPNTVAIQTCVHAFYAYFESELPELHRNVRDCLESTVKTMPEDDNAWSHLAFIYLDEHRLGINRIAGSPALDRAVDAARRAIVLDQANARAHLALSQAFWFKQYFALHTAEANRALALNPNDPLVLADVGIRRALRGDMAGGMAMVRRAIDDGSGRPAKYRRLFALSAYVDGDYARALDEMQRVGNPDSSITRLLLPAIYEKLGRHSEAAAAWAALSARRPEITEDPRAALTRQGLSTSLIDALMSGFARLQVDSGL